MSRSKTSRRFSKDAIKYLKEIYTPFASLPRDVREQIITGLMEFLRKVIEGRGEVRIYVEKDGKKREVGVITKDISLFFLKDRDGETVVVSDQKAGQFILNFVKTVNATALTLMITQLITLHTYLTCVEEGNSDDVCVEKAKEIGKKQINSLKENLKKSLEKNT